MNPTRKRRLWMVLLVLLGAGIGELVKTLGDGHDGPRPSGGGGGGGGAVPRTKG